MSPVTRSSHVNEKISFAALPDDTSSFIAARGPACIGCVALSTKITASVASILFDRAVEIVDIDRGVCPSPSPSSKTSLGMTLLHVGTKGPATRTPLTSGVRSVPNNGA